MIVKFSVQYNLKMSDFSFEKVRDGLTMLQVRECETSNHRPYTGPSSCLLPSIRTFTESYQQSEGSKLKRKPVETGLRQS